MADVLNELKKLNITAVQEACSITEGICLAPSQTF
jgi:hypothetical protein